MWSGEKLTKKFGAAAAENENGRLFLNFSLLMLSHLISLTPLRFLFIRVAAFGLGPKNT